jgi:hypothetical protein
LRAPIIAIVCVLVASLAACGGRDAGGGQDGQRTVDDPVRRYGLGPTHDPNTTYQDDVVLIDDGPRAVRSVSDDGLVWTMDGAAKGIRDVRPGKIMFATSEAVGRVVKVEPRGDDVAVTLGPAALTSIVKDGELNLDRPLDLDNLVLQEVPGLTRIVDSADPRPTDTAEPTSTDEPEAPETTGFRASGGLLGAAGSAKPLPPPKAITPGDNAAFKIAVGDFDAKVVRQNGDISLRLSRQKGIMGVFTITLQFSDPRVRAKVSIKDGHVTDSSVNVTGFEGIRVDIDAGSEGGVADNMKTRLELPFTLVDVPFETPIGPMVCKWTMKFLLTTGFTQKKTTLRTSATYRVAGGVNFTGGQLGNPKVTPNRQLVENLSGPTIGVTGLVVAAEFKGYIGYGLPVVSAGIYSKTQVSFGLTTGSSAGLGEPCHEGTAVFTTAVGVGLDMSHEIKSGLTKLIGKVVKEELEVDLIGVSADFFNQTWVDPDGARCLT